MAPHLLWSEWKQRMETRTFWVCLFDEDNVDTVAVVVVDVTKAEADFAATLGIDTPSNMDPWDLAAANKAQEIAGPAYANHGMAGARVDNAAGWQERYGDTFPKSQLLTKEDILRLDPSAHVFKAKVSNGEIVHTERLGSISPYTSSSDDPWE